MIRDYYKMIAAFVSQYVFTTDGGAIPADPKCIRGALFVMMNKKGYTKDEIKYEAIRDFNVIIREDLFPDGDGF